MKKAIKVIGLLTAFVLAMLLNTNAMDSDNSVKFNLTDAISINSANAECPPWIPPSLCDDPQPYAEKPVPVDYTCPDYSKPVRVHNNDYDVYGHIEYEPIIITGSDCESAWGPWDSCVPEYPC
ncbi:hypothetical protein [Jejuia pallidilutea]|jgi:hypothetical protein|uniref:Uncharacterized protein n=1 Tax=Jejuia pallidilutea TaxID=504487 RepID=A0A090W7C5_9FLAO|nr:hypothetical protein [Jejuia pallidilutea]GAL72910.1 hypothetical protein JCM19302_1759 [Jejuia pallidilutea]GAL91021.1 hypothetical protein JCM19538_1079 [Jejuia pallidilutea]